MIVGRQAGSGSQTRCPGAKKGRALQYGPPPIDGKPAKAKPALGLRAAGSNSPWLVQLSRGSGSSVLGPTDGFKAAAFDRLSQEAKGPWRTMRARGLLRRKNWWRFTEEVPPKFVGTATQPKTQGSGTPSGLGVDRTTDCARERPTLSTRERQSGCRQGFRTAWWSVQASSGPATLATPPATAATRGCVGPCRQRGERSTHQRRRRSPAVNPSSRAANAPPRAKCPACGSVE